MTNYNERLDEILMTFLFNGYGQDAEVYMPAADGAKQAITSLTKELMEEAKPANVYKTSDGQAPKVLEAPAHAYDVAIQDFEQNLLKALEEK